MILLIDNYDSFVFNLAHALRELDEAVEVVRNDEIRAEEITAARFQAVILGPGPGTPRQAGICLPLLRSSHFDLPLLGVCLGHQAIAAAFGARISRTQPVHGRSSLIHHNNSPLFAGLPNPFPAARYHSLAAAEPLPPSLCVTAYTVDKASESRVPTTDSRPPTTDSQVMALAHIQRSILGVQFHPESILTECGHQLLANFLQIAHAERRPLLVETA